MRILATIRKIENIKQIDGAENIAVAFIMEGVVIRTTNQNSTRFKSFKYINPEFLIKYGE